MLLKGMSCDRGCARSVIPLLPRQMPGEKVKMDSCEQREEEGAVIMWAGGGGLSA